jgi:UPF0176 protein
MRRAVLAAATLALGGLLAGCGTPIHGTAAPVKSAIPSPVTTPPDSALPKLLPPAKTADCPYVGAIEVQNDNGQHVDKVRISSSSDGQPHPVCYFYRPDGHLQLTVRVYVGTPAIATALVNQAAPIKTSSPADQPPGWNGGAQAMSDGAVYAIAKGGTAIVVLSNQLQSIKCRLVATAVAGNLSR